MMPDGWGFWWLLLFALVVPVVMMAVVWAMARVLDNAGIVDIFWSYGFFPVAVGGALLGAGDPERSFLLAAMVGAWSLRLGSYLLVRVARHHPEEDGRYAALRAQFPRRTWAMFFGFFQMQALLITLLSVPFLLVFSNPSGGIGFFGWAAFALWLVALAGESVADAQLHRFRMDPANRGRTCRAGLWRYSRHPNYFCEWLVWVAYFLFALGSPWGWATAYAPALMYFFLTRVTGIKATEEQAVRSRGEEYREYQRTTNAFFPWQPGK